MIRSSFLAATLMFIGVVAGARTSAAANPTPAIIWDADHGIARGSGCDDRRGDTSFITSGNDMAVLFTRFGVNFQPDDGGPKSDNKACNVRVPVLIRNGNYGAQL